MPVNQTPEVLKAARLLGPALGRKANDPGTLRLAAAVLSAEPAKGDDDRRQFAAFCFLVFVAGDVNARLAVHRANPELYGLIMRGPNSPYVINRRVELAEQARTILAAENFTTDLYRPTDPAVEFAPELFVAPAPRSPWPEAESIAEL